MVEIENFCFQEKIVVAMVVKVMKCGAEKNPLETLLNIPHLSLNAASIVLYNASAKRSSSNHPVARRNR